jgi:hypothetical protein
VHFYALKAPLPGLPKNLRPERDCVRGGGISRSAIELADALRLVPHPYTAALPFRRNARNQSGKSLLARSSRREGEVYGPIGSGSKKLDFHAHT